MPTAKVDRSEWCVISVGHDLLTGLKFEDFGKETQGEMVIEFLQMKHKCVIAVHDAAAADADTRY